mmetsp:Transcript_11676/g.43269  ORF Transcript_11676/g.43269 Transcript_11676/m.43269 type:complete len:231 (+) Transcript_11676:123-815(+)
MSLIASPSTRRNSTTRKEASDSDSSSSISSSPFNPSTRGRPYPGASSFLSTFLFSNPNPSNKASSRSTLSGRCSLHDANTAVAPIGTHHATVCANLSITVIFSVYAKSAPSSTVGLRNFGCNCATSFATPQRTGATASWTEEGIAGSDPSFIEFLPLPVLNFPLVETGSIFRTTLCFRNGHSPGRSVSATALGNPVVARAKPATPVPEPSSKTVFSVLLREEELACSFSS